MPSGPVRNPSAWSAAELAADPSWIHELGPGELAELDAGTAAIAASSRGAAGFGRGDYPLSRLGPRIARMVGELEHGRGCVLIRGIDVEHRTLESAKLLYWGLAVHLGEPISQNARGERIAHVADSGRDYDSKNVRGYTTRARLRPHCDACDVVGLLCWRTARSGGESLMSSSVAIYNEIASREPELLPPLFEGFHYDLRGEGATGDENEVTFHRVPVFSWHAGRLSCRFNQKSIEEGMTKAGKPIDALAQRAIDRVGELALDPRLRFDLAFRPGDVQLLNNHSVLHSRNAFEDWPEPERKRNLLRLWLNLREGRALEERFADRLEHGTARRRARAARRRRGVRRPAARAARISRLGPGSPGRTPPPACSHPRSRAARSR